MTRPLNHGILTLTLTLMRPGRQYLIALVSLTGCATTSLPPPSASPCTTFLATFDQKVTDHHVHDAQATPVPGFPYLRTTRLLASLAEEHPTGERFTAWVEAMRQEDMSARRAEWANLPASAQGELTTLAPGGRALATAETCGQGLARDASEESNRERLLNAVAVPDDYQAWKRVLGLYWLSAWPIKWGVERWHRETRETFQTPLDQLPIHGHLVTYAPPTPPAPITAAEVRAILERAGRNPLGMPTPTAEERERLFAAFAPTWQVDTLGYDDRLGAPVWPTGASTPQVATSRPTVYRHLSHTRFQGHILAQLNYTVWFPARPFPEGKTDLLGGHMDGLTWRVTLSPAGRPLVYDTIHNCGCYHLFFPAPGLRPREGQGLLQEPAFAPQTAPELAAGQGPTVRLSHTAHFVERVSPQPAAATETISYRWAEYDALRALESGGGRHGLFGEDGIVPGTERGERWLFWTMGVPNPGEMRQWGHHATAFFGRRHFDDPYLMETSLEAAP